MQAGAFGFAVGVGGLKALRHLQVEDVHALAVQDGVAIVLAQAGGIHDAGGQRMTRERVREAGFLGGFAEQGGEWRFVAADAAGHQGIQQARIDGLVGCTTGAPQPGLPLADGVDVDLHRAQQEPQRTQQRPFDVKERFLLIRSEDLDGLAPPAGQRTPGLHLLGPGLQQGRFHPYQPRVRLAVPGLDVEDARIQPRQPARRHGAQAVLAVPERRQAFRHLGQRGVEQGGCCRDGGPHAREHGLSPGSCS